MPPATPRTNAPTRTPAPRPARTPAGTLLAFLTTALVLTTACATSTAPAAARDRDTGSGDNGETVPFTADSPTAVPAPDGPNIVLITTDDQTLTDLSRMPRTQRLLSDAGLTFTNMISPHPLCCPSRAEMITGQYAQNNGVKSNGGPYGGFSALIDPDNTLPAWLTKTGYHSGIVGKFLNGWKYSRDGVPAGWEHFDISKTNDFRYRAFKMFTNGATVQHGADEYSSDYATDETVGLINRWSEPDTEGTERPFFIWTSYYAPHGACDGEEVGCKTPPIPDEEYADDFEGAISPSLKKASYDAELDNPNPTVAGHDVVPKGEVQDLFLNRIRALQSVDAGIGKIIAALKGAGELDDTVVMFTSDNGYLLGEHRYLGKVLAYEEALRVPLLVRGPGIPAGQTRDQVVTMVDIAPTITALTGSTAGRLADGRNLVPVMRQNARLLPSTILIQAGGTDAKMGPWMYRGVRTDRWTFTVWNSDQAPFYELYDRSVDPEQIHNLAADPAYRDVVRDLLSRTRALNGCAGTDECFRTFEPRRTGGRGSKRGRPVSRS